MGARRRSQSIIRARFEGGVIRMSVAIILIIRIVIIVVGNFSRKIRVIAVVVLFVFVGYPGEGDDDE